MANPIAFKPAEYDPKQGLMRKLEAAPAAHAEALLVAYDLLQTAHDQGILDTLHGMVHAKDEIFGHLAEGARVQESVDALRNLVSVGKILGAIEPETMSCIAAAMSTASKTTAGRAAQHVGLVQEGKLARGSARHHRRCRAPGRPGHTTIHRCKAAAGRNEEAEVISSLPVHHPSLREV